VQRFTVAPTYIAFHSLDVADHAAFNSIPPAGARHAGVNCGVASGILVIQTLSEFLSSGRKTFYPDEV
jgi:hypothetical protein